MKYTILIFALIFGTSPLLAGSYSISYLKCDEAKSQLQIRGSFGTDSGSVTIEDTTLGIVSWSDSLIICNLPDSGKGSGGDVIVHVGNKGSYRRTLSIFNVKIDHPAWHWSPNSFGGSWGLSVTKTWVVNWRMDISSRSDSLVRFEGSKSSYGLLGGAKWPYHDTSQTFDHGFTFWGIVNLHTFQIHFGQEKCIYGVPQDTAFYPRSIHFDTTGFITGYTYFFPGDSMGDWLANPKITDSVYNQKILFPPNPKNIVREQSQPNDPIKIWQENHSLIINSENPLGPTTASLYTIDGRLLTRTKLNISAA